MRSDLLLEVDWRLALLEAEHGKLAADDRAWVVAVCQSCPGFAEAEPAWEFAWGQVAKRARRLLVADRHPSR